MTQDIIRALMLATVAFLFYYVGYQNGFLTAKLAAKPEPPAPKPFDISELKEALINASPILRIRFHSAEKEHNLGLIGDDEFRRVCRQIKKQLNEK